MRLQKRNHNIIISHDHDKTARRPTIQLQLYGLVGLMVILIFTQCGYTFFSFNVYRMKHLVFEFSSKICVFKRENTMNQSVQKL